MEFMAGTRRSETTIAERIGVGRNNQAVTLNGMVHSLRSMGALTFLTLRTRQGVVQCVCPREAGLDLSLIHI